MSIEVVSTSILIILPILTVIVFFLNARISKLSKDEIIRLVTYTFILVSTIYIVWSFKSIKLSEILNYNSVFSSLIDSKFTTENTMSFTFGLFTLFFLFYNQKGKFLLSLFITFISFKRIVLLGLIVSFFVYFLLTLTKTKKLKIGYAFMVLVINLLLLTMFYHLTNGTYDDDIKRITGISTNLFTAGRQQLYLQIYDKYGSQSVLGEGLGTINTSINDHLGNVAQLCSDIIKNYFEMGMILFCIWLFSVYYFSLNSIKLFSLTLYLNVLYITDNVFIYYHVLFFLYLFYGFIIVIEKNEQN